MVEQTEDPGADGDERRHGESQLDRPVVVARCDPVLAHLVGHSRPLDRVDLDAHGHRVLSRGLPRLVGQRSVDV